MRIRTVILLPAVLGLAFSAPRSRAGWVENRDGTTVIHVKVFELPDPTKTDTFTRSEAAGVRTFVERFPEIFAARYRDRYAADPDKYGRHNWDRVEIELEKFTGIIVRGVEVDLLAIAGGLAPDVLYVNFRKSDNYIQSGFLYPLDNLEDGYLAGMSGEETTFRINPKIWPVIRRRGPGGTKRVWAMPYGGALGRVLLFRRDLFDKHHISYPTARWTWDDLLGAVRQIADPANGIYGMRLTRGRHESFHWTAFLWSAGGEVMEYDEDRDRWRCVFDSDEAAVAADFFIRLSAEKWVDSSGVVRRGYAYKDVADVAGKWSRGEIGMVFEYIDEKVFATINPELTGMVPVPLGPTGKRGGELNSRMMGLFAGIEDPVVRDAAWEYIRFYSSKEAQEVKTRIMVEGGLGQFVNPKYLRMFGYPEIERLAPKGWSDTFDIAIDTGRPEPYGRNSNLAYDMMSIPLQRGQQLMLADKLPADDAARLEIIRGLLKGACARANEEMIGIVPPGEQTKRRWAASAVLLVIALSFALVFVRVARAFAPPATGGKTRKKWAFQRHAWAYALLLPAVLTILVWRYVPLLRGSVMAFQDYQLMRPSSWVGVDNFGSILFNHDWWQACWNSLRYSFLVMSLTFLPPIVLAILLQEVPRGKLLFRTVYYLPAVITGIVTILLWKQFYEPSERGVLNAVVLRIPAWGFVTIGVVLLVIALLFARRLRIHDMNWQAGLFVLAGVALLYTCCRMAEPILLPAGQETSLFIRQSIHVLLAGFVAAVSALYARRLLLQAARWQALLYGLGAIGALYLGVRLGLPLAFPGGGAVARALAAIPVRLFSVTPEAYHWLRRPETAMLSCVIPMVWAGMGPGCLIYLAALKGIPEDYYEAADIDGATFIDKILFVVFPTLKALVIINFIGAFIASWYTATGNILVMTGGAGNTEVAGLHIWYKAFTFLKFGPATAMAWMLGFMLIGFTVHQLRILSRVEFRAQGEEGEN